MLLAWAILKDEQEPVCSRYSYGNIRTTMSSDGCMSPGINVRDNGKVGIYWNSP